MNEFKPQKRAVKQPILINFQVTQSYADYLAAAVADSDLSRSEFIRQCIDFAVSHMDRMDT